jgi:hypothetical protein
MSIRVMNAVWEHGPADRAQLLLMLALADFSNDVGEAWPSINVLALKARMVPRSVIRGLKDLEMDGWLSVARKTREHKGNSYLIAIEKLISHDRKSHDRKSHDKKSGDIPGMSQVTNRAESGDKSRKNRGPFIYNHQEPSGTVNISSEASLADDPDPVPSAFEESELALNGSGDPLAPVVGGKSTQKVGGNSKDRHANQTKAEAARRVFDYYLAACDRSEEMYTYTPGRKRLLLKRLDEALKKTHGDLGKAQALMQLSVDGISGSAWHMGRDPKTDGKTYCELEKHVFRTLEQMEGWYSKCS